MKITNFYIADSNFATLNIVMKFNRFNKGGSVYFNLDGIYEFGLCNSDLYSFCEKLAEKITNLPENIKILGQVDNQIIKFYFQKWMNENFS